MKTFHILARVMGNGRASIFHVGKQVTSCDQSAVLLLSHHSGSGISSRPG